MPMGPGRYDKQCVDAKEACKADGAILMVFNGEHGNGFSAVLSSEIILQVPDILRRLANEIENSFPKI